MAKINARGAHEVAAVNVKLTRDGETSGFRFVLRSDRAILYRLRWTSDGAGKRRMVRGSSFSTWTRRIKEGVELSEAVLVGVLERRGFERDVDEPKPKKAVEQSATPEFGSLREKIQWEKEQRRLRYEGFAALVKQAHEAGMAAGEATRPVPMVVQKHANPLDDNSPVVKTYAPVMDGACGFAYVTVYPGNTSFAIWAKKNAGFYSAYKAGVQLSVRQFNQSMERKLAYAQAYAKVLQEAGITAYPSSRMD